MAILAEILGDDVQLTGNPVEIKCTGGSIPAGSTNYEILLKTISPDSKLEKFPRIDAKKPDTNGERIFDISGIVDQDVDSVFQYPVADGVVANNSRAFSVQVQPGESWLDSDGVLHEEYYNVSDPFLVLKGGFNPQQIALSNSSGKNFYTEYLQNGRFLTPRPWGDFVYKTQPVKLWFMVIANVSATFKVRCVYDDTTDANYSEAVNLTTDNLYEFNCNPADLGIDLEPEGKKAEYFDVWLENGAAEEISDVRRFQLDWKYCERPQYMLFTNSLGGIDDVLLRGQVQQGFKANGKVYYKPQQRGATPFERTLITPNKTGQNMWKINTGYKSATQMLHLRDAMVSKEAWLLLYKDTPGIDQVYPVTIENTSEVLVDREKDLWDITFELVEGHNSKFSYDTRIY